MCSLRRRKLAPERTCPAGRRASGAARSTWRRRSSSCHRTAALTLIARTPSRRRGEERAPHLDAPPGRPAPRLDTPPNARGERGDESRPDVWRGGVARGTWQTRGKRVANAPAAGITLALLSRFPSRHSKHSENVSKGSPTSLLLMPACGYIWGGCPAGRCACHDLKPALRRMRIERGTHTVTVLHVRQTARTQSSRRSVGRPSAARHGDVLNRFASQGTVH